MVTHKTKLFFNFLALTTLVGGIAAHPLEVWAASIQKNLRVFLPQDVVTLDWNQTASTVDFPIILNIQEGLIEIDEKGKVFPLIAQSWKVSSDGKKFNFYLRKNILWSDGKPLSADDFVLSWRRVMNPVNGFSSIDSLSDIEQVTAISSSELEVKLKAPNFNWYLRTASPVFFPIRQSLLIKNPSQWTMPGVMVTLGPFLLSQHDFNQSYLLKKNPSYFFDKPKVESIEFKIGSLEKGIQLLKEDKVDVVFQAPVQSLKNLPKKIRVNYHSPQLTKRLEFNFSKYPTGFVKFRRAIAQAISRDALAKYMGERFVPGKSYVPIGFRGHDPTGGIAYDPVSAKKTIREMFSLEKMTLNMLVPCFDSAREDNIKIALYLQKELKNSIGIELNLQLEADQKRYSFLRDSKDWHMILRDFSGSFFDSANFYEPYGTSGRYGMKWQINSYDEALLFAKGTSSEKESDRWLKKCDEILTRMEVVLVPLAYQKAISILGPRIIRMNKKFYEPSILKSVEVK